MINFILLASLTAFIITLIGTIFVRKIALKHKLIDNKNIRKHPAQIHEGSIPRAGGLALYLGIILPIVIFLPLNKALVGIILACTLTVIIGLVDDKYDLNPYVRFIGNLITGLVIVGAGIGIPYINNPFNGIIRLDTIRITFNFLGNHSILPIADVFALLFIIWTMNVVGWSSGVDGQLPGFIAISSLVMGLLSLKFSAHDISQLTVCTLAFITMGSYLGFLPWNFFPQKIMPGYGGKTLAGLLLATLSILSGAKVGTMLLVLGLPMTDALYTIFRRVASGKSPFWADRKHLHHKLLDLGWGKRRIAVFYWLVSAVLGLITLTVSSGTKLFIFISLIVIVGAILIWLKKAASEFT